MSEYKAITIEEAKKYLKEKGLKGWKIGKGKITRIYKKFKFKDFVEAVKFVENIRDVAESLEHHPDLCIESYNLVRIFLTTHDIKGLSTMDLELAEKIEEVYKKFK